MYGSNLPVEFYESPEDPFWKAMRAPTADFFLRPNLVAIPPSPFLGPKMEPKVVAAAFSDSLMASGFPQVWSLTQFNSVDLLHSRISAKKCVSYKYTSKV